MIGNKFGRLTVISPTDYYSKNGKHYLGMVCVCDCGQKVTVRASELKVGHVQSCGCLIRDFNKTKIGNSYSSLRKNINKPKPPHHDRLKRIWKNMNNRCHNPNATSYETYGGRGINVCQDWHSKSGKNGFEKFYAWAIDNGYDDNLSIDRINNDKGYSPDNCRWATAKEQRANQRKKAY